jgi:hypothetical protein
VNCGDKKDRENTASIGRARTCEKFFSECDRVGFYAFGRDRKMTEKWDFRAFGNCEAFRAWPGTERGKARQM